MSETNRAFLSLFHIGISIQTLNKRSEKKLGLSLVQWCFLRSLIDMPSTSANALSAAVGVHPSTLTQTLKRLERKDFIFIAEDPKDSRKKLISITRNGKNTLERVSRDMSRWAKDLSILDSDLHRLNSDLHEQLSKSTSR